MALKDKLLDALDWVADALATANAAIARVRKAAVPVVITVLGIAAVAFGADSEVVAAIAAVATTLGVYAAKNEV